MPFGSQSTREFDVIFLGTFFSFDCLLWHDLFVHAVHNRVDAGFVFW